jgi:hypothetical protein
VASKYILILIIIAAGAFIGSVFAIPSLITQKLILKSFVEIMLFSINIALLAGGIQVGFIYTFSSTIEKIELLTVFAYLISLAITFGLQKLLSLLNKNVGMTNLAVVLCNTLVVLVIFYISYRMSIKVYSERNFS